ncbi:hypothetical protein Q5H93_04625 [Hymenobacter sp. ASUV-10]|uniref:Uncharacterized protein n=1 Tax=Hymenobacter aranciens TaxID=3063996 RepID=A0ABT9B6W1_9BACT|nr:hypothetical protein [Hymenobacter sp. ASUV-10]MDO7874009.1 hypothetical protein [Hymenobacter sp. ASUV-10]
MTYRQLWRWQLVLSIVRFFVFHLYWHQQRPVLEWFDNTLALVLLFLAMLPHFGRVLPTERLFIGLLMRYFSSAALLLFTGGLGLVLPSTAEPRYNSWHHLNPGLLEAKLALATVTVVHEVRTAR